MCSNLKHGRRATPRPLATAKNGRHLTDMAFLCYDNMIGYLDQLIRLNPRDVSKSESACILDAAITDRFKKGKAGAWADESAPGPGQAQFRFGNVVGPGQRTPVRLPLTECSIRSQASRVASFALSHPNLDRPLTDSQSLRSSGSVSSNDRSLFFARDSQPYW